MRFVLRSDHLSGLLRHRTVSGHSQPPPQGHEGSEVGGMTEIQHVLINYVLHLRVPASLKYLVFEVLAKVLCIKLTKEKRRKSRAAARPGGQLEESQSGCVFCLPSPSPPTRDTGRSQPNILTIYQNIFILFFLILSKYEIFSHFIQIFSTIFPADSRR